MFLPLMFTAADPGVIKGGAPVYGVGICAPQKLKHFVKKKRSQPTDKSFPPHQLPFLADKLHKNPYIARYTLTTLLE